MATTYSHTAQQQVGAASPTSLFAQVTLPSGHVTYVPVRARQRSHTNPKWLAFNVPTLGRNRHFRGGRRAVRLV